MFASNYYFLKFKKKIEQNDLFIRKLVRTKYNFSGTCYRCDEADIAEFGGKFQIT